MANNFGGGAPDEGKCNALAARLRINAAMEIRVVAQEYSGRCYLHIRQYFLGDDNEFRFCVVTWEGMTKADIRSYFSKDGMNERQPGKGVRFNLALLVELERGL